MMFGNPSQPPSRSRGAALIAALMTVTLATLLATQLITAQGEAIQNLIGRRDLAQARWLARGAADWARAILTEDARTSQIDHAGESWAIRVPPIPIKSGDSQDIAEGELSGEIVELDGRFNLNRLVPLGSADQPEVGVFVRLLQSLGVSAAEADRLTQAVVDAVDGNAETREGAAELAYYGVVFDNQPLLGVGSLLGVPGFTPALVARLQPFVSALPQRVPLNLNTAPAEVLAAELPTLGLPAAQRAVADRERAPFRDVADFKARFAGVGAAANCGVASRFFLITTRSSYGESVVQLRTLLYRGTAGKWPDILWQQTL